MKKYNFDLILSDEVMKANRLRTLEQDKDKKSFILGIVIVGIILTLLMITIIKDDNEAYNKIKASCEAEQKQIVEYYRYDGEKSWTCK